MEVKEYVVNRLTEESYRILSEMSKEHVALKGETLSWFQALIAKAEETNDQARALAATVVMKAYAEEQLTHAFDPMRLTKRIDDGIQLMVSK